MYNFKTGDKVLVRDEDWNDWSFNLFSHKNKDITEFPYVCLDSMYVQCIPLEGNEHLLGTTDSPERTEINDDIIESAVSNYIIIRNRDCLAMAEDKLFSMGCRWMNGLSEKNNNNIIFPCVIFVSPYYPAGVVSFGVMESGTLWRRPLASINGLDKGEDPAFNISLYDDCEMDNGAIYHGGNKYIEMTLSSLLNL